MRDTWGDIGDQALSALALLTRLPVPDHRPRGAASAWAWPLVGTGLGALAALAGGVLAACGLPEGPVAAAQLVAMALLTGALHEDGLADTADGLLGGRTRERRLEIMKDSRIGSFGALALVLVVVAQWSALSGAGAAALIAAATLSRLPMVLVMAALPPARQGGLSAATGRPSGPVALAATALALAVGMAMTGPVATLGALLAMAAVTLPLAASARARIGGQTGDILGAAQALSLAAALAVFA